jgi:hypothetical protein
LAASNQIVILTGHEHENLRFSCFISLHQEDLLANIPDANFLSAP